MPIPATKYIWFNGKLVPWEKATVHVLSHALHYGSSVFEGVRAYETPRGPAIFRLRDHTKRLFDSAKIYRIHIPFSEDQLNHAQREVIAQNGLARGAYLRPVAFRGYGEIGVVPKIDPPVDVAVAAWEWGKYLGAAEDEGVDVVLRKFEVRSVSAGEDAQGEALVYVEYNQRTYRGSSVSTNIVESATQAFLEVINRIELASSNSARVRTVQSA
jgi:branched-subunit amino acid aminotransferase/4-amino-4-deoxychorismate lyase